MNILDQRARSVEYSRNGTCATCITTEARTEGTDQPCNCICPVCVAAQTGTCQAGRLDHPDCQQTPAYHVIRGRTTRLDQVGEWRLCESHALDYRGLPAWRVIALS
jgi:hypothetical protein